MILCFLGDQFQFIIFCYFFTPCRGSTYGRLAKIETFGELNCRHARIPVKSRRTFCPNRKESGFYDLWKHERDNFEKAMPLEENCSRFNDTRSKIPFCLLANRRKTLRRLKAKFEQQSKLVMYFQIPCMMLEYTPIKEKPI